MTEPIPAGDQPPATTPKTNPILVLIFGVFFGLAAQVLVVPVASFLGLALVEAARGAMFDLLPSGGTGTLSWVIISATGFVFEVLVAIGAFALAKSIRQIDLFQGCLIGLIIGWLLFSGCWSLLAYG